MRREEQALIEGLIAAGIGADLRADAGRCQAAGDFFHKGPFARHITAGRGQSPAGVFDQRTGQKICAGLARVGEFAVAVVHHHAYVGADAVDGLDGRVDLPDGERRPPVVAARALDEHQFDRGRELRKHALDVYIAVRAQGNVAVANAKIAQRTVSRLPAMPMTSSSVS